MPLAAQLLRLISLIFVVLMAPKGTMRRVRGLDIKVLWNLLDCLAWMQRRGRQFWYPGESLAVAARRLDLILWIAQTPARAHRHLVRHLRGWERARHLSVMPPSWDPPQIAAPALDSGWGLRAAAADT